MLHNMEARVCKCKGENVPFLELDRDVTQRRQVKLVHVHLLMCVWRPGRAHAGIFDTAFARLDVSKIPRHFSGRKNSFCVNKIPANPLLLSGLYTGQYFLLVPQHGRAKLVNILLYHPVLMP
jgi:hypothetical protein